MKKIICYYGSCKHHDKEGPYCYEADCKATESEIKTYETERIQYLEGIKEGVQRCKEKNHVRSI